MSENNIAITRGQNGDRDTNWEVAKEMKEVTGKYSGWNGAPKKICPCPNSQNLGTLLYLEKSLQM